jgi:hypothetical protein
VVGQSFVLLAHFRTWSRIAYVGAETHRLEMDTILNDGHFMNSERLCFVYFFSLAMRLTEAFVFYHL